MRDMRHMYDSDDDTLVENPIDHPKLSPAGRVPDFQPITKWLSDSVRVLGERTSDELPASDSYRLR
ncbi:hypothetical protein A4G31_07240 [Mycobacterium persicum]|nr:hypothetical protein A4G31_07240 [Mycobacterium persicum]